LSRRRRCVTHTECAWVLLLTSTSVTRCPALPSTCGHVSPLGDRPRPARNHSRDKFCRSLAIPWERTRGSCCTYGDVRSVVFFDVQDGDAKAEQARIPDPEIQRPRLPVLHGSVGRSIACLVFPLAWRSAGSEKVPSITFVRDEYCTKVRVLLRRYAINVLPARGYEREADFWSGGAVTSSSPRARLRGL
jgi:hypothetical protein